MKTLYFTLFYGVFIFITNAQNVILEAYTDEKKQHLIEWVVTECSYISHFEIERRIDNNRFEVIYTKEINSYDCNGNYTYTIKDFPKGYQYDYRIKAYLNTALPVFSGIATVFYQPENVEITHFAINVNTIVLSVISRQKNSLTLTIIDISGKLFYKNVFQIQAGKEELNVPVNIPSTGIYFVQVSDRESHLVYQKKYLLKNN